MDTDALMRRAAEGDARAFEQLVRLYQPRLQRYAMRLLDDPDAADDAAQEALLRFWRVRLRWRSCEGSLEGFLLRVVRNVCLDSIRAARRMETLGADSEQRPSDSSPAGQVQRRAQVDAIRRAVRSLPEPQQTVFILSQYEGLAYAEIAALLGCPLGTVASRKHQAMQTLRQRLWDWREEVQDE